LSPGCTGGANSTPLDAAVSSVVETSHVSTCGLDGDDIGVDDDISVREREIDFSGMLGDGVREAVGDVSCHDDGWR
jgi:hypothetical protein